MLRKPNTFLPIAVLLGAVSTAPALAQTRDHAVQPVRSVMVSSYAHGSDAYDSNAMQARQDDRQALGETPALPFTQDPDSAR
jgi:hypothetical protein